MKLRHFYLFLILLSVACSADRNNVISKTYHNTTARYNAYFYAKKDIAEIKKIVKESHENDYNHVLKIYPPIDSTLAKSYEAQIEDCIKKASIAIQRHKNSKWVDDSYILIGLARFYSLDYVNAIETFKYVNTQSKDNQTRIKGLVHLHRTFTDYKEYSNAIAVSDYLKKEKLNKENSKLLFINRAHYYQTQDDYNNMVQNLVKAAPLLKKKDGKGRIYFIIGQVYQMLGFDSEAFNYYKKCIASNPEYELDFYARLYMAQVTQLGKSSNLKAARKLFKNLLKDKKNKEFKDKIYYEMADFELRQGNIEKSISYLQSSVRESIDNNRQKGQSYLKLGQIHYDSLRKYELAKSYYDSTIEVLPSDFENYEKIRERQEVLVNFVEQITVIELQDSLLSLATLDSAAIMTKIDAYLTAENAKKELQEQKRQRTQQKRQQSSIINRDQTGIGTTSWYFGNPSAVALGQTDFKRIWGDRPLEDNWRRSSKDAFQVFDQNPENTNIDVVEGNPEVEESTDISMASEARALYAQIPFSAEAREKALKQIELAYFKLGNIYYFDLKEEENAASSFETLLERFPGSENEPEVLYQLFLINKNLGQNNDEYKELLLSKYPNTTFAKLIANPNYTEESTAANEQQKVIYKQAYNLYDAGDYSRALFVLDSGLNLHQETVFTPRLRLLKILVTGKTENINLYQYQLTDFIEKNPDSDITPYAGELLEASRNFQDKQRKLLGTEFVKYFDQDHYFIIAYKSGQGLADKLSKEINDFNTEFFSKLNLKTSNLILNESYDMVMVTRLEGKTSAENYFKKFVQENNISENTKNSNLYKFVITKDNFNILYQSKALEAYLRFFEKNYSNEL